MKFLIAFAEVLILLLLFHKTIKKYAMFFYIGAICCAIFGIISVITGLNKSAPSPIDDIFILPFVRGTFATALFVIVMWLGVLPKKYSVISNLYMIRGEISIMACILALGHNIAYGIVGGQSFVKLFTNPSELQTNRLLAAIVSIILLIIMIPLFVTSFPLIRKKMKASFWKKLQRWAYLFYTLIYVHLLLLYIPLLSSDKAGKVLSAQQNLVIYSLIFIPYFIVKIIQLIKKKSQKSSVISSAVTFDSSTFSSR